ncbi:PQQ-binding-like beta-propeller repeat protein [Streptomyces sp. NPDC005790]|uniref:protein kinase domain-containing protein n=1 Tax=Streptomyces sp. NPDC005790 TaxID=3154777 RepID=UPI003401828B
MKPLSTGDPIRLGPYRILGVLGEGGMGKVYVGRDGGGTVAAVKVLHPHLAHDPDLARRFVREAQMAQAVGSEGVAEVIDSRTEGGRPWIATEFLVGPTLDEAVAAHGPLGEPAVRALAVAMARGLRDIHAAGLVHRDVKPGNIVLTATGPRIIDFGIARPEHGLTLTVTGQVPVTPGYGAPEQVLGHRVGPAADVFSLGAVLVYAASGRRAYDGAHAAAVQYDVVHGEPRLDGVPDALRYLIAPCLAKDPALRPTTDAIATAFDPPRGADRVWRHGPLAKDVSARRRSLHELTTAVDVGPGRSVPRRRLLTALVVGGGIAAAGGGTALWLNGRGDPDPFSIPPAVKTPTAPVLSAEKGDYVFGVAPEPLWRRTSVFGDDSPAPLPVRDVVVVGAPDGGIAARAVVDGKPRWSAPGTESVRRYVSLSDELVAAADGDGVLRTFVASTGEPRWTAAADASWVLAADDEAVYVVTDDGRLRSVGRADGEVRWSVDAGAGLGAKPGPRAVTAAGRLIVAAAGGTVVAVRTDDGGAAWELRDQAEGRPGLAATEDTVFVTGEHLRAVHARDGAERWVSANPEASEVTPYWGPPTVHGTHVYAAYLGYPQRLSTKDGAPTDWVHAGLLQCHAPSPLVVQGDGFWSVAVNDTEGGINVIDLADDREPWVFRLIENPDRYWLTADANRVFVVDGDALTALPVF